MDITHFLLKVDKYIINPILDLLFAVAFLYFIYGIVRFLKLDAADKSREEAKMAMVWGMVGILIMFSVYGIIQYLILPTFGVSTSDPSIQDAKPFLKL